MKLFWKLIKILTAVLSLFGIVGFGKAAIFCFQKAFIHPDQLISFVSGGILFVLLWFLYFSRRQSFWSTLEHELTHALFALLFFKRIQNISASRRKGGLISIEGGNVVIALAPYFFPLSTMIVILIKPFIQLNFQIYLNFLVGFTYFFHMINTAREFHFGQSDIQSSGYIFSVIVVVFLNIFFGGIIIASFQGEWHFILNFAQDGIKNSVQYIGMIYNFSIEMIQQ